VDPDRLAVKMKTGFRHGWVMFGSLSRLMALLEAFSGAEQP
jgi:hypothetical protein